MMLKTANHKSTRCVHGNGGNCSQCSSIKMVAYDHNDQKTVWYSYFKEDQKYKSNQDKIFHAMANRFAKKVGEINVKKIMFFENKERGRMLVET
ncbi:hypothetical protein SAMN04487907_101247 [Zunongwangia mangrovi]|uniref:Uncharacterized protein n=1 Tax=Zunongwangia mangrovi TaxID=1334022 RepID=A0A1I1DC69_9FLAO|nr:hypothetical protein [Zunongwangia mangrovi]SFB71936.1 hypothetical protein SAMN04487907_101247 [Zunongwangia mangrovi]